MQLLCMQFMPNNIPIEAGVVCNVISASGWIRMYSIWYFFSTVRIVSAALECVLVALIHLFLSDLCRHICWVASNLDSSLLFPQCSYIISIIKAVHSA
jgi:hypothetical protein